MIHGLIKTKTFALNILIDIVGSKTATKRPIFLGRAETVRSLWACGDQTLIF